MSLSQCIQQLKVVNEGHAAAHDDVLCLRGNLEVLCKNLRVQDIFSKSRQTSEEFFQELVKYLHLLSVQEKLDDVHTVCNFMLEALSTECGFLVILNNAELCFVLFTLLPPLPACHKLGKWTPQLKRTVASLLSCLVKITRHIRAAWRWPMIPLAEVLDKLSIVFLKGVEENSIVSQLAMEVLTHVCRQHAASLGVEELRALHPQPLLESLILLGSETSLDRSLSRRSEGLCQDQHSPLLACVLLLQLEDASVVPLNIRSLADMVVRGLQMTPLSEELISETTIILSDMITKHPEMLVKCEELLPRLFLSSRAVLMDEAASCTMRTAVLQLLTTLVVSETLPLDYLTQVSEMALHWVKKFTDEQRSDFGGPARLMCLRAFLTLMHETSTKLVDKDSSRTHLSSSYAELSSLAQLIFSPEMFIPFVSREAAHLDVAMLQLLNQFCSMSFLEGSLENIWAGEDLAPLLERLSHPEQEPEVTAGLLLHLLYFTSASKELHEVRDALLAKPQVYPTVASALSGGEPQEKMLAARLVTILPKDSVRCIMDCSDPRPEKASCSSMSLATLRSSLVEQMTARLEQLPPGENALLRGQQMQISTLLLSQEQQQRSLEEARVMAGTFQTANHRLQTELLARMEGLIELKQQLDVSCVRNTELRSSLVAAEKYAETLSKDLDSLVAEKVEIEQQMHLVQAQQREVEEKHAEELRQVKRQYAAHQADLKERVQVAEKEKTCLEDKVGVYKKEMSTLQEKNTQLQNEVEEQRLSNHTLTADLEKARAELQKLNSVREMIAALATTKSEGS